LNTEKKKHEILVTVEQNNKKFKECRVEPITVSMSIAASSLIQEREREKEIKRR